MTEVEVAVGSAATGATRCLILAEEVVVDLAVTEAMPMEMKIGAVARVAADLQPQTLAQIQIQAQIQKQVTIRRRQMVRREAAVSVQPLEAMEEHLANRMAAQV